MKLNNLLYISLFLPFISSCSLDKEPYGLTGLWDTQGNAQKGLDACYQPFYEEDGFGRGQWWAGVFSDDMLINREKQEITNMAKFTTMVNTSGNMYDNWQFMYRIIRRANDVLANVPNIDMPESDKNIMLGEANFLCAYSYFYLAKRFGGLPFLDANRPDGFEQEVYNKPRETKEKTYENIENYLLKAINCFTHTDKGELWERDAKDWGRPNLGAAYGLLAKVYAHWGTGLKGIDDTKAKEMMGKCKDAAYKVIESGRYQLDTTTDENHTSGFDHLFSLDGEKSSEVLFNLTNTEVRHKGSITSTVLMSEKLTDGKGWYYFAPTKSLDDAFETGDLRRKTTLVTTGDHVEYIGKKYYLTNKPDEVPEGELHEGEIIGNISDMTTGFMCVKYSNAYKKLTAWQWESGADVPLLRYADVLLIYVEALMYEKGFDGANKEATTQDANILQYYNEVHMRAFGNKEEAKKSSISFMDLVKERRCELAYEDERHYDLVRWGLAKEVYGNKTTDSYGGRTFDPEKNNHLPLPQTEIENSNGVLINNPADGYSNFKSIK